VCLHRFVVRVLTDNDNLHFRKRTEIEGVENIFAFWIYSFGGVFLYGIYLPDVFCREMFLIV
jgi:hypothetical protein